MSNTASNALANLELPSPDGGPAPQFTSLAGCKRWLADVAITNTALARDQLQQQLERLNRHPLPAAERLAILEFLRSPLHFIHDEWLRPCLLQRPELPLAAATEAGFAAMHTLWQALASGYLLVLQNAGADERTQAALAATRALATMRGIHLDHCHLGLIPGSDFWQRLHRIHYAAECLDLSQLAVADKLAGMAELTATGAYVETLLLAAARPHELQPKQLGHVAYWARRWAAKVPLLLQPPEDPRTPPLCIDLAGGTAGAYGPTPMPTLTPPHTATSLRWLDLRALRKTIKQRLVKLGEGVSPQELKLGKDCVQPACELLLRQVYRDWCKGGRPAGNEAARPCELLAHIEAIHFQLSGKPFNPARQSIYLDKRAHEELATFGHIATRAAGDAAATPPEHASEHWQAVAGSVVDLQLQRPLAQPGGALAAGRLVGVRQQHAPGWQLARIGWIASDLGTASLRASARLLPGTPQAVGVIRAIEGTSKTEHCRGFHLPAVPGLEQAATILTPIGWFRPGQPIEIKGERSQKVRLVKLLERGADFERCTYDPIA